MEKQGHTYFPRHYGQIITGRLVHRLSMGVVAEQARTHRQTSMGPPQPPHPRKQTRHIAKVLQKLAKEKS